MAGNQIRSDLEGLMAKVETAYGTDPTPTEGVDLRGNPTTSADRVAVQRARMWGSVGRKEHAVIDDKITFNFQVAVGGAENEAGGVPGVDPFLQGAGMALATSGDPSTDNVQAQYSIESTSHGSFAMYRYLYDSTNGQQVRLKLLGCRCNIEIVIALNAEILMNVTGEALYAEWEALADLTDPTSFSHSVPSMSCQNMTHTLNSTARRITELAMGTNWTISQENSVTGTSNAHEILLSVDRTTGPFSGSFNPVMLSGDFAASSSLVAAHRTPAEQAHVLSVTDGIYTFAYSGPRTNLNPNFSIDTDGAHRRFGSEFAPNATDSGDDEMTLTFTTS